MYGLFLLLLRQELFVGSSHRLGYGATSAKSLGHGLFPCCDLLGSGDDLLGISSREKDNPAAVGENEIARGHSYVANRHRLIPGPVDERGNHLERNSPKTLSQETFSQETKESIL